MMSLYQKLLAAKKKVPYLQKDTKGFNYSYAGSENVLETFNPIYNDLGILIIPNIISVTTTPVSKLDRTGKEIREVLYLVMVRYDIIDTDKPEDRISISWAGSGVNGDEKGFGSALTYSERYLFLKLNQVATGMDDPDARQDSPEGKDSAEGKPDDFYNAPKMITTRNSQDIYNEIKLLVNAKKVTQDKVLEIIKKYPGEEWLHLSLDDKEKVCGEVKALVK